MTEDEFWDITPRAFFNAVEGFESLRREDLKLQRLQTLYLINYAMGPKKPIQDPKKLWTFAGEITVMSDRQRQLMQRRARYLSEKFERIEKRHGG